MTAVGGLDAGHEGVTDRDRRTERAASRGAALIQAGLARIIEGEILPRLARAHREEREPPTPTAPPPTPERVVAFAHTLITDDPSDEQVRALLGEGLPLDTLLLDLLAPAARHLGWLWEEDEADFIDVTVALGRLHGLARVLRAHLEATDAPANGRRVLLLPCPGETHLFSLALVASFFREAGWAVVLATGAEGEDLIALIQDEHFDLVGVSLSCDVLLPALADLVTALRVASCNPAVRVMVGGPLFLRDPTSAVAVGADAAAEDGRSAVLIAETLFAT